VLEMTNHGIHSRSVCKPLT